MKKVFWTMVVLGVMVAPVAADVVNGNFTASTLTDDTSPDSAEYDQGWCADVDHWGISGGIGARSSTLDDNSHGIGQIAIGDGLEGSWIKFDLAYTADDVDSEQFRVVMVGFNDADDNFTINVRSTPNGGGAPYIGAQNFDSYTTLYDSGRINASGSGSLNIDQAVASGTGYDYYAFAVLAIRFNGTQLGDSLTIDNVSIVPEPATLGLLVCGGLGLLLKRRRRIA